MPTKQPTDLTVDLDRLIDRESLRYRRSEEDLSQEDSNDYLLLRDLSNTQRQSVVKYLRKPDFQRATSSWTPDDCISLLESVVRGQVIPSIVMWKSPDELNYILDGAHRISAIIAWLSDNWGDRDFPGHNSDDENDDDSEDPELWKRRRQAASEVRLKLKKSIGLLSDFEKAEIAAQQLAKEGKSARELMGDDFERALFYRRFIKGDAKLHILWAKGNYEQAESSFLQINKGGKKLEEWETKVVEDRNSSFVRTIMSIANVTSVRHFWPKTPLQVGQEQNLADKISAIHSGISSLHEVLFTPPPQPKFVPSRHPFFYVPSVSEKPQYLAELLAVVTGTQGTSAQIAQLIREDKESDTTRIINNGWELVTRGVGVFEHLTGQDTNNKSLGIVPLLYFYNNRGSHIRSLLYGFIYWLLQGTSNDVMNRKRVFAIHRAAFERVLLRRKGDIVGTTSRGRGSGPEVTLLMAKYYQQLLETLIKHRDVDDSAAFSGDYRYIIQSLTNKDSTPHDDYEISGRIFTSSQKTIGKYTDYFANYPHCALCGGFLDLSSGIQHDHSRDYADGGATSMRNRQSTHPFCNQNETKAILLSAKSGKPDTIPLPPLQLPT